MAIKSLYFILKEVPYSSIPGYLNASDIGVVLRDFHEMNRVVIPGKLLDYLGCGLPVITTSVFGQLSKTIYEKKFGIILEDLNIKTIKLDLVKKLLKFDNKRKQEISNWANNNLSVNVTSVPYIKILKSFYS